MERQTSGMPSYPSRFDRLRFSEQFILWSARNWVLANRQGINTADVLREPFDKVGAPRSFLAMDAFMTLLSMFSNAAINIQCTCKAEVNEDENHLLNIFCALQAETQTHDASSMLGSWMPPTAARAAAEQGHKLARDLKEAGLQVRDSMMGEAMGASGAIVTHKGYDAPKYLN